MSRFVQCVQKTRRSLKQFWLGKAKTPKDPRFKKPAKSCSTCGRFGGAKTERALRVNPDGKGKGKDGLPQGITFPLRYAHARKSRNSHLLSFGRLRPCVARHRLMRTVVAVSFPSIIVLGGPLFFIPGRPGGTLPALVWPESM